ncbi:MAG: holdfast anchoring protein HfaB [Caulobacteraceae bacterium]
MKSTPRSGRVLALLTASAVAISGALAGCVSPVAGANGLYAKPIGNAPVTANQTPYSEALVCEAEYARAHNIDAPRIAVGRIADYTGKLESDGSGRKVTQGASLMAISAFAKAGMPLVERYDTSVSELELKYANNKLISDDPNPKADAPAPYRRILAGQVPGSDFYLVGGITELNFNLASAGANIDGGGLNATDLKAGIGGNVYVMNVGLDLRLVNTRTLVVEDVISYQKQIVAHEVSAGLFKIFNNNAFDIAAGRGGLEPLQLAVRSVIERATVEMVANLYGMPGPQVCMHYDPLGAPVTTGPTGAYVPAYNNLRTNNASTRADPNRWNDRRDPDFSRADSRY